MPMKTSMRRAIRFVNRYKVLLAATAVLMAGAGCLGAARETGNQLVKDALVPVTASVNAYKLGVDAASNANAYQRAQQQASD